MQIRNPAELNLCVYDIHNHGYIRRIPILLKYASLLVLRHSPIFTLNTTTLQHCAGNVTVFSEDHINETRKVIDI